MDGSQPFFKTVEDFVIFSGGDHAIEKVLIANNGIGATKAIRSIRRWCFETFGNERKIKFVVMATPEDMRANAEYIRMADQVVDVPGGSNNNNYANITLICQIAERLMVDAVMPMWGHASENPALPESLAKLSRKVSFVGPPPEPMRALGDKIGSTIIAQSAGVPTIAWNGDGITVDYKAVGIPQSTYDEANVTTAEDALACCERIGYPVMIKASEGGGGKGIRKVHRSEDVLTLYRQVQAEIPGSPIFVMKMASQARHLEVQLIADKYGEAIALSGRDCSVQRRHQKIIEEGPPTAASAATFKKMEKAAVSLAKTVGYCNAGTVEYLFMEETGTFAFLELNPRLQVEHPVTENILGINLPACQLQVAMGIALHRIADVRKLYGRHPAGKDTIDFEYSERVPNPRHCIAVRVTAENPSESFQPTSGNIEELHFYSAIDVWGYFSVNNSGLIHEFADSQFGHIFAGGKTREEARKAMVVALKELQIRGDIRTTIEYIIRMLQSEDFVQNRINTDWLDGRIARYQQIAIEESKLFGPSAKLTAACGAALQGYKHFIQRDKDFLTMLAVGQVSTKEILSPVVPIDLIFQDVKYITKCVQSGPEKVIVECNGGAQAINIRTLADGGYLLTVNGESHVAYIKEESGGNLRMILDGSTCLFTPEYDPTKLSSSVAGKLARHLVADGSHVNAGDPYVEIEVMKMYMSLKALESGTVHFKISEGATLSPGDVIALVTLDNPDSVVMAEEFADFLFEPDQQYQHQGQGSFDSSTADEDAVVIQFEGAEGAGGELLGSGVFGTAGGVDPPHVRLKEAVRGIEYVLEGFPLENSQINDLVNVFISSCKDPLLPVFQVEDALSVLRGRLDADLAKQIVDLNNDYKEKVLSSEAHQLRQQAYQQQHYVMRTGGLRGAMPGGVKYPATRILLALTTFYHSLPADKRTAFNTLSADLRAVVEPFVFTTDEIILSSLVKFLETYIDCESLFDKMSFTDVVNQLRKEHAESLDRVLQLCRSHVNVYAKNFLLLKVMEEIKTFPLSLVIKRPELPPGVIIKNEIHTRKLKVKLGELSRLSQEPYSHVAFAANLLIMDQFTVTKTESRRQRLNEAVLSALTTGEPVGQSDRVDQIKKFVDSNIVIGDILVEALNNDSDYQVAVMELYLHKVYQKTHDLKNMSSGTTLSSRGDPLGEDAVMNPWILFHFSTKAVEAIDSSMLARRFISFTDLAGMAVARGSSLDGSDGSGPGIIASTTPFTIDDNASAGGALGTTTTTTMDLQLKHPIVQGDRIGVFALLNNMRSLEQYFPAISAKIPLVAGGADSPKNTQNSLANAENDDASTVTTKSANAIHVAILEDPGEQFDNDDKTSQFLEAYLATQAADLRSRGVRRVSFVVARTPNRRRTTSSHNFPELMGGEFSFATHGSPAASAAAVNATQGGHGGARTPSHSFSVPQPASAAAALSASSFTSTMPTIFTFRNRIGFQEDTLFRYIEAPHAFHLDLHRLSNFNITLEHGMKTSSGNVHLYRASPKSTTFSAEKKGLVGAVADGQQRYFARIVSFTSDVQSSDVESLFVESLDQLALVKGKEEGKLLQSGSAGSSSSGGSAGGAGAAAAAAAAAGGKAKRTTSVSANNIFINVVSPDKVVKPDYFEDLLRKMSNKYWEKLRKLGVTTIELKLSCRLAVDSDPVFIRLVASNPTGFVLKVDSYFEALEGGGSGGGGVAAYGGSTAAAGTGAGGVSDSKKRTVFRSMNRQDLGPLDGKDTQFPYPVSEPFEKQRADAMAASDTLYVYDWPVLFEHSVRMAWQAYKEETTADIDLDSVYATCFSCQELVLLDSRRGGGSTSLMSAKEAELYGVLMPSDRKAGLNDVGMVAWLMTMRTPECPDGNGRQMVVICNDITFQAGSFGTREDVVFYKASEYARVRGIPRIFLTANSGARIGMAQSLKKKFHVCWQEDKDPSKGFKYIYLPKGEYEALVEKYAQDPSNMPVCCNPVEGPDGDVRYVITDIIGEEPDLGVENLMGSGLIAGETSRAYEEIFTLTIVVGRTVGIGAYLVRLGKRTIQKRENAPIILTGYQALNKLMGREIYTTNDQLGGPMIMYPNGVSHMLADSHQDSVSKALQWLSFVPPSAGAPLPIRNIAGVDRIDRLIQFAPKKGIPYDPRLLFCGCEAGAPGGGGDPASWQSGFLDRNSFVEVLAGWAKTVIAGRGRIGGIPLGLIVTENRTAEATKPADPADLTSQEKLVQQAGGVWFPDSAYKTAQALKDFNRECLPCIIFANWRGFSGGQRDMFDEVLKFGSMIVDALVAYQQPLFVYIPPFAELRGGAWVVVDSTINSDVMEFYAAEDARGGVLEAAGAASIKFREKDIVSTAHRIDPTLIALDKQLKAAAASVADSTLPSTAATAMVGDAAEVVRQRSRAKAEVESLKAQIKERERMLFGVYQQVAVHFADLHDTPGRMKAKGVIRRQVQWAQSRTFFYWRLRRRLKEFEVANALMLASSSSNAGGGAAGVVGGEVDAASARAVAGDSATEPPIAAVPGERKLAIAQLRAWVVNTANASPTVGASTSVGEGGSQGKGEQLWEDDRALVEWMEGNESAVAKFVASAVAAKRCAHVAKQLAAIISVEVEVDAGKEALAAALAGALSEEQRAMLKAALN